MNKKLQEEARIDFMLENINEILLVDPRAKRLLMFIIRNLGLRKALKDPRLEAFVMSLEGDEPDYDILTEMIMDIKGYKVKPLDYLNNAKDKTFNKEEIMSVCPALKKYFNCINAGQSFVLGGGFVMVIDGNYYKIYNTKKDRMFDPIYIRR